MVTPKTMMKLLVLYFLESSPMHGYKLMKKLEELIGHTISPGILYPLLKELLSNGLVEVRPGKRGSKPVKTYFITLKGIEFLRKNNSSLHKILNMIRGAKELREMGGEELRTVLGELMSKLPDMSEEEKERIRRVINDCLNILREIVRA